MFVGSFKVIWDVRNEMRSVKESVENVEKQTAKIQFRISYPVNGNFVELTSLVIGSAPYSNRNYYIVVTPLKTGDNWIQDAPVMINIGNSWTGHAKFGNAAVGQGEKFVVYAIATISKLNSGPLNEVPKDAIFSEPVTVIRKK